MSRKPTGPGRGGDAVEIVSAAMAFQSRTASARAICDQPRAANAKRGRMVKLSSRLFDRTRYMGSSLLMLLVEVTSIFLILDCQPRAYPPDSTVFRPVCVFASGPLDGNRMWNQCHTSPRWAAFHTEMCELLHTCLKSLA